MRSIDMVFVVKGGCMWQTAFSVRPYRRPRRRWGFFDFAALRSE
jgi:hypothetical protein